MCENDTELSGFQKVIYCKIKKIIANNFLVKEEEIKRKISYYNEEEYYGYITEKIRIDFENLFSSVTFSLSIEDMNEVKEMDIYQIALYFEIVWQRRINKTQFI